MFRHLLAAPFEEGRLTGGLSAGRALSVYFHSRSVGSFSCCCGVEDFLWLVGMLSYLLREHKCYVIQYTEPKRIPLLLPILKEG